MTAAALLVAALLTSPALADGPDLPELPEPPQIPSVEEEGETEAAASVRQRPLEPVPNGERETGPVQEAPRLKPITEILPYFDYEPDRTLAREDPCHNLCPRPPHCLPTEEVECPSEARWPFDVYVPRHFADSLFTWEASNLFHHPLYFEDVPLERYGHSHSAPLQPFVSIAKFSAQLVTIPYQATIDPIHKRKYVLGHYRPGDHAPKLCYQPPWNWDAALVQAGVTSGLILILP